ncbi:caspase-like protein, partial [Dinothrombium tinctorium]
MSSMDASRESSHDQNPFCIFQPPAQLREDTDSEEYFMKAAKRGPCLIFNHENFDKRTNQPKRRGTANDRDALQNSFRNLGCNVKVFDDLTFDSIYNEIHAAAKQNYANKNCFICCILTHGDGKLFARDRPYDISTLLEPFHGDRCQTLAGKPKIFIIQACQGDKFDNGVLVKTRDMDVHDSVGFITIPTFADYLIAQSSVPGYYSWRDTNAGSWFIQSLTETIDEKLQENPAPDFMSILTTTTRKVAYKFKSNNLIWPGKKQVPCIFSTLTRRIHFYPKN